MQEAQVAVQAGTQPVARLWSCLLSLLPAANSVHTIVLDVGRNYSCPLQLRAFQPWDFARMV